ncbi:MAG: preprotein translocase subunit Sec61beta [Candidatus Diapherotrites archaeon]|nr:preprotein translocase subunit Sec61beta [Candidatus Diapherotrites archaeon]
MKVSKGPKRSGPSSAIGILNFFDADTSGPKLSPEFVLLVTVAFIVVIVAMHIIG